MKPETCQEFKSWLRSQITQLEGAEGHPEIKSQLVPYYKHNEAGLRTALRIYGKTASMVTREILRVFEKLEKEEALEQSRINDARE